VLESGVMFLLKKKIDAWIARNKMTSNYSYKSFRCGGSFFLDKKKDKIAHMSYFDATINHLEKASK
jgi:hypothetical protein